MGVAGTCTLPAVFYGYLCGHDWFTHLAWSRSFTSQFWSGELYPRWLLSANSGLGSPAFFYYGPIPYFLTAISDPILSILGMPTTPGLRLGLSATLAVAASGITFYCWMKSQVRVNIACFFSVVYMLMPYHLLVDLYTRFALAELWAFVWMPLVLYYSRKIAEGSLWASGGLALSYSLLFMTHLPTTVVFAAIPMIYVLLQSRRPRNLGCFACSVIGALGLSAIYLIPALLSQRYISMDVMWQGELSFERNFLFSGNHSIVDQFLAFLLGRSSSINDLLSCATLLCAVLSVCITYVVWTASNFQEKKQVYFWLAVVAFSIFMMLPASRFIWGVVEPLQKIQFPWRFSCVLTLATCAGLCLCVGTAREFFVVSGRNLLVCCLGYLAFVFLFIPVLRAVIFPDVRSAVAVREAVGKDVEAQVDRPEYRPRWVHAELYVSLARGEYPDEKVGADLLVDAGRALCWRPREVVFETAADRGIRAVVKRFYYPGWIGILGSGGKLEVVPTVPEGLVSVWVPRGNNSVHLTLRPGFHEAAGKVISIGLLGAAGIGALGFLCREVRSRRRRPVREPEGVYEESGL